MENTTLPLGRHHTHQTAHSETLYLRACAKRDSAERDKENEEQVWEQYEEQVWSDADEESDPDPEDLEKWFESNQPLTVHEASEPWVPENLEFKEEKSACGPQNIGLDEKLESIFAKLLPDSFFELAVVYTNTYAANQNRVGWKDTFVVEMKGFVGILFYFGRKGIRRIDAWSKDETLGSRYIKQAFTERRFIDLMACFHLVDNDVV